MSTNELTPLVGNSNIAPQYGKGVRSATTSGAPGGTGPPRGKSESVRGVSPGEAIGPVVELVDAMTAEPCAGVGATSNVCPVGATESVVLTMGEQAAAIALNARPTSNHRARMLLRR